MYLIRMLILILSLNLFASDIRPLSMQPFDVESEGMIYGRGNYLIVLPDHSLDDFLTNESFGGDFIKFKKTQGFNVDIIYYDETTCVSGNCPEDLKASIMDYYNVIEGQAMPT